MISSISYDNLENAFIEFIEFLRFLNYDLNKDSKLFCHLKEMEDNAFEI